jgi:preprotein translocase subunit SecA
MMSSSSITRWSLPAVDLYPERSDEKVHWLDKMETVVTSGPKSISAECRRVRMRGLLKQINSAEATVTGAADEDLKLQAVRLRDRLRRHGLRNSLVVNAFALIREISRRELQLRHRDEQILGGLALLNNMIIEMDTGEGKTLTATLAVAAAALAGIPVHVVTVNDYLAQRDAESLSPLYEALGLTVGTIIHGLDTAQRRSSYNCDITYASNKEITFDYLRDKIILGNQLHNLQLKLKKFQGDTEINEGVVMRGLHFAIVDEADSVLVDEARTPLIISRETNAEEEKEWAKRALASVEDLERDRDYRLLVEDRRVELLPEGKKRLAELGERWGGIWQSRMRREEAARQALSAQLLFQRGDHYLVMEDRVQIVDEYSGRIMADRSWTDGLHQLIEAKEGCKITSRKQLVARMTYQRFFRRYNRLAGMTGTAREVRGELWSVYRRRVIRVPPHLPPRRSIQRSIVCATEEEKWKRICARTAELIGQGRPVLIGTRSVLASEKVSEHLLDAGLDHVVLNAAQDRHEAEIIARAGEPGRITVATNMAGRGVDIRLGESVIESGGLHVVLSERHEARRIDRQLVGRAGRNGEPGSAQSVISLEDPLLKLIHGRLSANLVSVPWPLGRISRLALFRLAQRRAERTHAKARRDLMAQDRRLGNLLAFTGKME